jgi:hypothetical protein
MSHFRRICLGLFMLCFLLGAQEMHSHNAPVKLGTVSFPISCVPAVQQGFNQGVALLHSFAYRAAEAAFRRVAEDDPHCGIAHWGMAMTYFHQLWEPPLSPSTIPIAQQEMRRAKDIGPGSERERKFINTLAWIFRDDSIVPYSTRSLSYERAICD